MSIRSLIEINHDYTHRFDDGLVSALQRYLTSASAETAESLERYGIRVVGQRHHSSSYVLDGTPDGFPPQYLVKPRAGAI